MNSYRVCGLVDASTYVTVQAATPEDAREKALEDMSVGLCHQCSRVVTTGDIYDSVVEDADGNVLIESEQDENRKRIAELTAENARLTQLLHAPTEAMTDAARSIIGYCMANKQPRLEELRYHVKSYGVSIASWPQWAREDVGHVTKGGFAEIVWCTMAGAAKP